MNSPTCTCTDDRASARSVAPPLGFCLRGLPQRPQEVAPRTALAQRRPVRAVHLERLRTGRYAPLRACERPPPLEAVRRSWPLTACSSSQRTRPCSHGSRTTRLSLVRRAAALCEANVPLFQRERRSRRTASASVRRPDLHILFRIPEGVVQGGTVFLVEPISGIERQELGFRSFGQVGGFINDQALAFTRAFRERRRRSRWLPRLLPGR